MWLKASEDRLGGCSVIRKGVCYEEKVFVIGNNNEYDAYACVLW